MLIKELLFKTVIVHRKYTFMKHLRLSLSKNARRVGIAKNKNKKKTKNEKKGEGVFVTYTTK